MSLLLRGAKVYAETGATPNGVVLVQDGIIKNISASATPAATVLDFPASYSIVPGFIDLHTHGAGGFDVMDATPEALTTISGALAAEGTTGFLATTMTAPKTQIDKALQNAREFMGQNTFGASLLGVHLEGPFLAAAKKGAQNAENLLLPDVELMQHWQQLAGDMIRIVTLAPEQAGSLELIKFLRAQNIIAAIGHTNATYAEAQTAIAAGCTHATHLFNAMRAITQREPGVATAILQASEVLAELIVDGVHLHPAIVQLALQMKGKDKIVLITDAMRAKCLADGCYELGGQMTQVKQGRAELADGTLAGSVLPMVSAIQNMLRFTGCDLSDALVMAALNPARILGLEQSKGSIAVGKDADLVVLNEALQVVITICGGKIIYNASLTEAKSINPLEI